MGGARNLAQAPLDCPPIQQTARNARGYCEACYQNRKNLWITGPASGPFSWIRPAGDFAQSGKPGDMAETDSARNLAQAPLDCPSIQQTARSAREYCEACYQNRKNLWITSLRCQPPHPPNGPASGPFSWVRLAGDSGKSGNAA